MRSAVLVYLVSLCLPVTQYYILGNLLVALGYKVVIFGWMSLSLIGLCNFLLFIVWKLYYGNSDSILTLCLSIVAALLSMAIYFSDFGYGKPLIGYYIWVLSFILTCFASVLSYSQTK